MIEDWTPQLLKVMHRVSRAISQHDWTGVRLLLLGAGVEPVAADAFIMVERDTTSRLGLEPSRRMP